LFRFNVIITVGKDSHVTDVQRFYDELVRSFQDVCQLLLASKLWNERNVTYMMSACSYILNIVVNMTCTMFYLLLSFEMEKMNWKWTWLKCYQYDICMFLITKYCSWPTVHHGLLSSELWNVTIKIAKLTDTMSASRQPKMSNWRS